MENKPGREPVISSRLCKLLKLEYELYWDGERWAKLNEGPLSEIVIPFSVLLTFSLFFILFSTFDNYLRQEGLESYFAIHGVSFLDIYNWVVLIVVVVMINAYGAALTPKKYAPIFFGILALQLFILAGTVVHLFGGGILYNLQGFIQTIITRLDVVTTIIVQIIAFLGVASILISASSRYARALKYGIPFYLTKQTLSDISDLYVEIFSSIVIGVLFPVGSMFVFSALTVLAATWVTFLWLFLLSGIFMGIGLLSIREFRRLIHKALEAGKKALYIFLGICVTLGFVLAVFSLWVLKLAQNQEISDRVAVIFAWFALVLVAYVVVVIGYSLRQICEKIFGEYTEVGIVDDYLILMKSQSHNKWIAVKCKVENENVYFFKGEFRLISIDDKDITYIEKPKINPKNKRRKNKDKLT